MEEKAGYLAFVSDLPRMVTLQSAERLFRIIGPDTKIYTMHEEGGAYIKQHVFVGCRTPGELAALVMLCRRIHADIRIEGFSGDAETDEMSVCGRAQEEEIDLWKQEHAEYVANEESTQRWLLLLQGGCRQKAKERELNLELENIEMEAEIAQLVQKAKKDVTERIRAGQPKMHNWADIDVPQTENALRQLFAQKSVCSAARRRIAAENIEHVFDWLSK